ncbi:hypothetical protein GCM10025864_09090 [Luteimicrobium album]|uniref:BMP family ABC transporter substrate-binding protein n=1 Tax=Luteimicrobium album TaxID=1054550 RepID=A0ABQ6HXN7_9MICO|nr:hypothetical protein [Luteimicrobium album]GMA23150.1 hypothetical protein GCM10025864_09090 [Luteimicrobium album]
MPHRPRTLLATVAGALVACGLAVGVAVARGGDDWSGPHVAPTASGVLAADFVRPTGTPSPEATITPAPGSWDAVRPSGPLRVVLLTTDDDGPTAAVAAAVRDWAGDEDVSLRTVVSRDAADRLPAALRAIDLHPDLVISAGEALVDPLAQVTPSHLDQEFLVVGAELAEPTANVTAADWSGASFRGEGLGASSAYDASSFTPERCGAAVRAGVASVLSGLTGIVVWLDDAPA